MEFPLNRNLTRPANACREICKNSTEENKGSEVTVCVAASRQSAANLQIEMRLSAESRYVK